MKEDLKNDDVLGERLAPAVMAALHRNRFFEQLEKRVYPDGEGGPKLCERTFAHTQALFDAMHFDERERVDIITVMRSRGGFCDCEILLNVDDRNDSPKSRYWSASSSENEASR